MKKAFRVLIAVLAITLLLSAQVFASGEASDTEGPSMDAASAEPIIQGTRIRVFETTDIHGYLMETSSGDERTFLYRLAYIAHLVNEAREDPAYDDVLLLDGGDTYQGTPFLSVAAPPPSFCPRRSAVLSLHR